MALLLRGAVLAVLVALVVLAVATPSAVQAPLPPPPTVVSPTPQPTSTLESIAPRPTPTLESIVSRVTRVTPQPIPTRTPTSADQLVVSAVDFAFMPQELRIRVGQTVLGNKDRFLEPCPRP